MMDLPIVFQSTLFLLKGGLIIGMLVYIAFAFIVLKQVKLMSETLDVEFGKPLRFVAVIHLAVAIGIFLFTLLV